MVFSSIEFLFFFLPIFFLIYYLTPQRFRNAVLIVGSLGFYAWGEPYFVLLLLLSALVNYALGRVVCAADGRRRKLALALACALNIGQLAVFKYTAFFIDTLNAVLGLSLTAPSLGLPLGISFYTFQAITYQVAVYRKQTAGADGFPALLLYLTMFPQLISGPIIRYDRICGELRARTRNGDEIADGIFRFVVGLGKKILLANMLGEMVDGIWSAGSLSVVTAWLGAVGYSLQIYFDFSGYSDMAIGLAAMLGFHFPENFQYPYLSVSVSEFWRRWHISLGSWFRDYVYFPLGGSRCSKGKMLRNLAIVWLLTGLWHGAAWTFVVWGCYHGVLICLEKLTGLDKRAGLKPLRRLVCLLLVMCGWVLFRSGTLAKALSILGCLVGFGASGLTDSAALLYLHDNWPLLLVSMAGCTPLAATLARRVYARGPQWLMGLARCVVMLLLLALSTLYLVNSDYSAFIYFQF